MKILPYTDLYEKYANRHTYECNLLHSMAGAIKVYRNNDYKLPHLKGVKIIADVWILPSIFGWGYDENKRRKFYRDAKAAKLSRRKDIKNEWYKTIEIIENGE
jgi:hypothetical protein